MFPYFILLFIFARLLTWNDIIVSQQLNFVKFQLNLFVLMSIFIIFAPNFLNFTIMVNSFSFIATRNDVSVHGTISLNVKSSVWSVHEAKFCSSDGSYSLVSLDLSPFGTLHDVVCHFLGLGYTLKVF